MVSESFDGEYTSRCLQWHKNGVVRGSSTRGGVGALIELIRLVRLGYAAAITVDGPKGPRHVAKSGPILVAKKTGQPILPVAITPSRCWVLRRSWDRHVLPRPFSRARLEFAAPILVDPDADEAAMERKRQELQACLDALERQGQTWQAERQIPRPRWRFWRADPVSSASATAT